MFLTKQELIGLTGLKQSAAQARFLANMGLRYTLRADGTVALRYQEVDAYTLSAGTSKAKARRSWEPDFSQLPPAENNRPQ